MESTPKPSAFVAWGRGMHDRSTTNAAIPSVPPFEFDVFLSHNGRDKPIVERIAEKLKKAGPSPGSTSGA
jgi:hypothetical protein